MPSTYLRATAHAADPQNRRDSKVGCACATILRSDKLLARGARRKVTTSPEAVPYSIFETRKHKAIIGAWRRAGHRRMAGGHGR